METKTEVAIEAIRGDIKLILSKIDGVCDRLGEVEDDVASKHKENRASIHELRGWLQQLVDKIHSVEIRNAGWSAFTGGLVAVVVKLIEHFWH